MLRRKSRLVTLTLASGVVLIAEASRAVKAQKTDLPSSRSVAGRAATHAFVWKSQTTGNEYRVAIEGATFRAEQVNIPMDQAHEGAYVRTTAQRQGTKWVGKTQIFLPCAVGHGPVINKCHLAMGFEITEMGSDLIRGRIENPDLSQFDCKSCNVPKTTWKEFVWVPKKQ